MKPSSVVARRVARRKESAMVGDPCNWHTIGEGVAARVSLSLRVWSRKVTSVTITSLP